jgi:hypothetical protein
LTRHAWLFAFFTAAIALPAACTFPDVTFGSTSSSSSGSGSNGGASTSNPTSSGGNTTTQNTGGVGPGVGGAGGFNVGGNVTSGGGNAGGGGPCPSAPDPCDCDNDGHRRPSCPGDMTKPNDDCADQDPRANPAATIARQTPINGPLEQGFTLKWDFNCDGHETPTWADLMSCTQIVVTCGTSEGWNESSRPACGTQGDLQKCKNACAITDEGNTTQTCL